MQAVEVDLKDKKKLLSPQKKSKRKITLKKVYEQRYLFLIAIPLLVWCIIFKYIPLWGWTMGFQDYKPWLSFTQQRWVGFQYINELFADPRFYLVMRNTIVMSFLGLLCGFTFPIIFALLLNELRSVLFKRTVQTISYLPHFVSWTIAASIITNMLSADGGIVNEILKNLHLIKEPIEFFAKGQLFWGISAFSDIWKETGWSSIIFLAAITGIDPSLYEAATVDGAGRFRKMWHITLPGIKSTILVMFIMATGGILNVGIDKSMLLGNSVISDYSDVLDYYVLKIGIGSGRFAFGTAIGVFKSLIGLILVFSTNALAKKLGEERII